MNIHNYPLTANVINDEDYYDVDFWNGVSYETRKISGADLKAALIAAVPPGSNIYNADGTLTGNRIITGDNFELFFQSLGAFIVHSHNNNTDNVIFEVKSDPVYHGFIVKDHNSGVHILACKDGKVEISDAYFLPGTDGTPGQIMATDGAGNIAFVTADLAWILGNGNGTGGNDIVFNPGDTPIFERNGFILTLDSEPLTANRLINLQNGNGTLAFLSDIVNLYNSDGTLTGNRQIIGSGYSLSWLQINGLLYQVATANPGQDAWEIDVDSTNMAGGDAHLKLYDINALKSRFLILRDGIPVINDEYALPNVDGNANEVLTTNGAGSVSWQPVAAAGAEKAIDRFYAYDMSPAAAGGGTYTWNGAAVGSSTLTTLSESYRIQLFSGTGQSDGCFVNTIMPSYYTPNADLKVTANFSVNGTGGNYKFFVGIQVPNGAVYGTDANTIWLNIVIVAAAGFPLNPIVFNFTGLTLDPGDPIAIKIYRDPGDAQDTYSGDAYLNSLGIEIA